MKFTLRKYQNESANLLRDVLIKARATNRRALPILCLPTGAGKTVTFSDIAEKAQRKGSRVGVCCHRKELIEQAKETMQAYGINPLLVSYGMVQTFVKSPHKIPDVDLWIIDECHIGNFRRFVDLIPERVQIIGATATPISATKKHPLREVFTDVVCPVQINELIEDGFLSRPTYHLWEINESALEKVGGEFSSESQNKVFHIDNLKEAYDNRAGKTIIFTSSIEATMNAYESIGGESDDSIFFVHSKMKAKERESVVKAYKETPDATIVNCGILTAGFDEPSIHTVVIYRATTSMALWLQMVGRGSRVIKGIKSKFFIFDLGGNTKRLGAWEINRKWEMIFDLQGRKLKDKAAPMKNCKECEAIIYASARVCPYCEAEQPIKEHIAQHADHITVIENYSQLPEHLKITYDQMTVTQLIERAAYGSPNVGRPFKNGWIMAQIKQRDNSNELIEEFARIKGYKRGWILRQL